mmetsp:Transcript_87546/g.192287  ORF Transcript_87546/g.192287 Transcript_87546/m.192287 type:complete len:477 (+) Transcript_87546:165-1595(+)
MSPGADHVVMGSEPVQEVSIFVKGLQGKVRAAAEATAREAKAARTLQELDASLRGPAASRLAVEALAAGGDVSIYVRPGPSRGNLVVHINGQGPEEGRTAAFGKAGLNDDLQEVVGVTVDHAAKGANRAPPTRLGVTGAADLSKELVEARFSLTPPAERSWQPQAQVGISAANILEAGGPLQRSMFMVLSAGSLSGRHLLQLMGSDRQTIPSTFTSQEIVGLGLQSYKTSLAYKYEDDNRALLDFCPTQNSATLKAARFEVSGFTDVTAFRAELLGSYAQRLPGNGRLDVTARVGSVMPFLGQTTLPLQDRFFFAGPLGVGMPGFLRQGLGPSAPRQGMSNGASSKEPEKETAYKFDKEWQTEQTEQEKKVAAPIPDGGAVDRLGGQALMSATATFQFPLSHGFQAFASVAGGSLTKSPIPSLEETATCFRAGAIGGIAYPLGSTGATLGFGYSHALVSRPSDAKSRWQFWLHLAS